VSSFEGNFNFLLRERPVLQRVLMQLLAPLRKCIKIRFFFVFPEKKRPQGFSFARVYIIVKNTRIGEVKK
jgi:hypothetical protein